MKKIILFFVLITMLSACNEPLRNGRSTYTNSSASTSGFPVSTGTGSTIVYVTPTPTATTGTTSNIPSEVSHCTWSTDGSSGFASSTNYLGDYTLCQSKTDETVFYFQLKTIPSTPVCILPTASNSGSSVYIGGPICTSISSNQKIYKITVAKNRAGFTNFSISGAMIMKDQVAYYYPYPYNSTLYSVDAYLRCMYMTYYYNNGYYCATYQSAGQFTYHKF